jgi:hypothetical protein
MDLKNLISTIEIVNIWQSVSFYSYVPKTKNLGRLIYRNDADDLRSFHSLLLASHRSSNQIAQMEKENLKLTNKMSSLITGDIKKNKNPHCEFCKLNIQLAVSSLCSILDTLKGVSK